MPISINLLKPIQTNSQQQLLPRNSQDTSSFVFKCACWSSRFFYLQSKQSILTFVCVLGYRPLSGFTGSAKYKVSNLICWNCQKDCLIHKFVLTFHWKHLDNNAMTTKNGKSVDFEYWCETDYFIMFTIDHVECFLNFDYSSILWAPPNNYKK